MVNEMDKTKRILSIYHLLTYSKWVSVKEMVSLLSCSKRTISRDIALLKRAGVQICYSRKEQAFFLNGENLGTPDFPESKSDARYIRKLIRLITLINGLPPENCDIWYTETIPGATKRTMQRDFATLNAIGYQIQYERKIYNMHDAGMDVPANQYYCDRPESAYSLTTMTSVEFENE